MPGPADNKGPPPFLLTYQNVPPTKTFERLLKTNETKFVLVQE